jgi:outer membrane lipoprotein SlyB
MRKVLIAAASTAALLMLPSIAQAQNNTMTGAVGGAVTGAIVGGPVGAAVGGAVGATVGASADANQQGGSSTVVVEPSAREQTCVVEPDGTRRCREVIR